MRRGGSCRDRGWEEKKGGMGRENGLGMMLRNRME